MSASVVWKRPRSVCENGSVFLEFVISASVFALFIVGSIDLIRVSQVKERLQMATDRVARLSSLGGVFQGMDRVSTLEKEIRDLSGQDGVTLAVCPASASNNCSGIAAGGDKQWMYVKATIQVPVIFRAGSITLSSESLVRNEPAFKERTIPSPQAMQALGITAPLAF